MMDGRRARLSCLNLGANNFLLTAWWQREFLSEHGPAISTLQRHHFEVFELLADGKLCEATASRIFAQLPEPDLVELGGRLVRMLVQWPAFALELLGKLPPQELAKLKGNIVSFLTYANEGCRMRGLGEASRARAAEVERGWSHY